MWKYEIFPTAKILREITLVWCGVGPCVWHFFRQITTIPLKSVIACVNSSWVGACPPCTGCWDSFLAPGCGGKGGEEAIFGFWFLDFWILILDFYSIMTWHSTSFLCFHRKKHTHFTESSSLSWGELFLLQFLEVVQARPLNDSGARSIVN